jgi:glycerol-1-phosphate dehydrogenase [NAD(P)+]
LRPDDITVIDVAKGSASLDPIARLLRGDYRDAHADAAAELATQAIVIEDSLAGSEAERVAPLGLGKTIAVVSDATTHEVLAARVEAALRGRHRVLSIMLERNPHADDATVARIRAAAADADAFVAVGSGTINDVTKYASALEGKPYAVFATAPSMNGYTSRTASITQHGHKLTLPAQAPVGAFFDLAVLAAAPKRMIRAGLGDSICRTTAQADWLLSHLLRGTAYSTLPFELLADDEPALLEGAADLVGGDLGAMRTLARVLVLSGCGTAIIGSSAPASQAEHLVSHYIDMLEPARRPGVLHGEQVGVTTLSIARLYEAVLGGSAPVIEPDTLTLDAVRSHFGDDLAPSVWPEFEAKRLDAARADALNATLASQWPAIVAQLGPVLLSAARIEAVLAAAGNPLTAEAIHLTRDFYERALLHGREIRNRYTIVDLSAQSGVLQRALASL